jgi:ABC-type glutathione transport system ATPase component
MTTIASTRPIIRVDRLVKKFGDLTAVREVSFAVNAGEIFAFLGPNGAGKTTTIKMLTTLLKPTSGSVEVGGPPRTPSTYGGSSASSFRIPAWTRSSPPPKTCGCTRRCTRCRAACAKNASSVS